VRLLLPALLFLFAGLKGLQTSFRYQRERIAHARNRPLQVWHPIATDPHEISPPLLGTPTVEKLTLHLVGPTSGMDHQAANGLGPKLGVSCLDLGCHPGSLSRCRTGCFK